MAKLAGIIGWGVAGLVALGVAGTVALLVGARTVPAPENLGVRDGQLAPCPGTPNCVSTQADPADSVHYIEPIALSVSVEEARRSIGAVIAAEQRVELLRDEPTYVHAVFRSATMGYPDDVEFSIDEAGGRIHFRSASRLGAGDMGVNRARMERLRAAIIADF